MARNFNAAVAVGLSALVAACASQSGGRQPPQSVPSRGVAMSDELQARCAANVTNLVSQLERDPSLAAKGFEQRGPSSEYMYCLVTGLSNQTGKTFFFTSTDNPNYYSVRAYPQ